MSINQNLNIKKFFNKLYLSFPNLIKIKNSNYISNNTGIIDIKYIYTTIDSSKWFVQTQTDEEDVFIFGKFKDNKPQSGLLILTFNKNYFDNTKSNGIITENNVYITTNYFVDNYPNFNSKLNDTNLDVFIDNKKTTISVIKLGDYINNASELIENINILIDELEEFKFNENSQKDVKTCEICGRSLKKEKDMICKKCSKKRHAANILSNLLKHIEPETPFRKKDLTQIYSTTIELEDCIWSLEDFNLIKHDNDEYYLRNKEILNEFIAKYSKIDEKAHEDEIKEKPKLNKTCIICQKTLPTSRFYKSKKTKDGFEDYCKDCKKYVNAANYLKDLTSEITPGSTFKVDELTNKFRNPIELIGRLWHLQDFDLLTYDSDNDTYTLTDLNTCENFLDEYYFSGSATIPSEINDEKENKSPTKKEQMDIVIECISNGKTEKEAAEIAGINLYNITYWYNEGKNNSSDENIYFYTQYIHAKKQAKINSMHNFYVIEAFNFKTDLTLDDTLRKQQMEKVLKELSSGASLKTAAINSDISYETLKYWYKHGQQNSGREYIEFYEKINILQSPIDIPKLEMELDEEPDINNQYKEPKKDLYEHILDPLPHKINKLFKGSKESESGFAWVRKEGNSWRYDRQQKDQRQSISRTNIYELYLEVKKLNYVWGVRNLNKAKITLRQCEKPNDNKLPEKTDLNLYELSCAYFKNNEIIKVIITGFINNNNLLNTLNIFNEFENKIVKIITTRNENQTDIFIEFNLKNNDLKLFRKKLDFLNVNTMHETIPEANTDLKLKFN